MRKQFIIPVFVLALALIGGTLLWAQGTAGKTGKAATASHACQACPEQGAGTTQHACCDATCPEGTCQAGACTCCERGLTCCKTQCCDATACTDAGCTDCCAKTDGPMACDKSGQGTCHGEAQKQPCHQQK